MTDQTRGKKLPVFLALQLVIVCAAVGAASHRLRQIDSRLHLPPLREEPLQILPLYDHPWVVSDEQLEQVLYQLRPRSAGPQPKINHVDHALRFWGVEASFHDPQCLSGEQLRALLTDHQVFAEAWGRSEPPLLGFTEEGVRVRTREGRATASHVDHTVAGLAEAGTPADFLITTPTRRATMGDLVRYTLRDFALNQTEYEWSTLTFALFLPPTSGFVTQEGQRIDFDDLAKRLMRERFRNGVCVGNHRLHTLTILLRIDQQHNILSDATGDEAYAHLLEASRLLVANQQADGFWNRNWSGQRELTGEGADDDSLTSRILATGHALEWLALAPESLHPPRETLVRAGQWLARTIGEMDPETVEENYTYLTHAGRALSLWRGRFPAQWLPLSADVEASASPDTDNQTPVDEPGVEPSTPSQVLPQPPIPPPRGGGTPSRREDGQLG